MSRREGWEKEQYELEEDAPVDDGFLPDPDEVEEAEDIDWGENEVEAELEEDDEDGE